mmetsp:Transcript_39273/g.108255  ORF Transcript_39273/g.108255 Transcript_39273/m.108255 type:complete len:226 (+) Transcript_39273:379-1056(+)
MAVRVQICARGGAEARDNGQVFKSAVVSIVERRREFLASSHLEAMLQVRDQVIHVLDSDRQTHNVGGQGPLFGRDGSVAHGAWHLAEAVHAAERHRRLENPASVEQPPGKVHGAGGEADHRPRAAGLGAMDREALGVAAAFAREEDPLNVRSFEKERHNSFGVFLRAFDPQVHGLDATQEEETLEWRESRALGVLQECDAVCELGVPHAHKATCAVRVARKELRC